MPAELKHHFVAFLDVLGFSDMVEADLKSENQQHLTKLFRCHQAAPAIFAENANCSITQFSDAIVVAMPFEASRFQWFASRVAEYQRLLLDEGLLCRGGLAVNKHFSSGSFTFSAGLIQAYRVESLSARYPRVVVAPDVIDLIYPAPARVSRILVREDDGLYFIDYLGLTAKRRPKRLTAQVDRLVASMSKSDSVSVREKGVWLAAYSDAILRTQFSKPRFTGVRVAA